MLTQCPECHTVYRLHLEQLKAARGQVQCSHCKGIFNALDHLLPQAEPATADNAATGTNRPGRSQSPAATAAMTGRKPMPAGRIAPVKPAPSDQTTMIRPGEDFDLFFDGTSEETLKASPFDKDGNPLRFDPLYIKTTLTEQSTPAEDEDDIPKLTADRDPIPLDRDEMSGERFSANESKPSQPLDPDSNVLMFNRSPLQETPGEQRPHEPQAADDEASAPPMQPGLPLSDPESDRAPTYALEPEMLERRKHGVTGQVFLAGGSLLLLAVLAVQILYYHQATLAGHSQLRPALALLCQVSECELPPQQDPSRIHLTSHLVQSHPRHPNSLLITATLINRADFAQPYPEVELYMTDLQQKVIASRRFRAEEYLIGRAEALMPKNIEIPLMLEILDPGQGVVGFRFELFSG